MSDFLQQLLKTIYFFVDLRDKDNGRFSFRLSLLPPLATKCYLYNVKVTECVLLFCLNRGLLDKYLPCPKTREKGNYIEKGFAYFLIFRKVDAILVYCDCAELLMRNHFILLLYKLPEKTTGLRGFIFQQN